MGKTLTEEMVDSLLTKARPDFIQVDCKGHPGVSSYPTKVGQQAASYDKDPLALIRKVTQEHHVALYVHYSGVQDHQYVKLHPEQARFTPKGKSDETNASLWGTYADDLLIPQMKELIGKYHIDGAWIDGECWSVRPDYQPLALKEFTTKTGITQIPHSPKDAHYKDFVEFNRKKFISYLDHYTRVLHAYNPQFQICSNWAYSSMMPEPITVGLDFLSGDFDPKNSLNTAAWQSRCLSGQGMPWDLMAWSFTVDWSGKNMPRNPKTALQLCQEGAEVFAMGGGFQVYFKQNADISFQPAGFDIMKDIADFVLPRRAFCHKAVPIPQIALFYSTAGWKNETNSVYSSSGTSEIQSILYALLDGQNAVDVLKTHQLTGRLKEYPVVVVPEWEYIEPEALTMLKSYAMNGGNLLVIGAKATKLFDDVLGIQAEDKGIAQSKNYLGYDGRLAQLNTAVRSITSSSSARPLASMYSTTDFRFPSGVVATITNVGKGKIAAVYADLGETYRASTSPVVRDFLSGILETLFPDPLVKVDGSNRVHVMPTMKDGRLMVNLVNTSGDHSNPTYAGFDEIPPLHDLRVSVKLEKKPSTAILQPGAVECQMTYANGRAIVKIPELKIHSVIEFR
ncbi:MAG TPA: hypothetical protein VFI14_00765 [Chryseosolibacter sp.]|nr:hypothetical protein [Chryseosolibacter sp.]